MARHTFSTSRDPLAARPNRDERYAAGKAIRARVPREQHGKWKAPRNRPNPVDLLVASSEGRVPELIPIRYGRMSVSPFTFYRGTALNMAADLAGTPNTGIRTAGLRRLPPDELRRLRHARAAAGVRHQRFRRDAAGTMGMGCQAARGELRARGAIERILPPPTSAMPRRRARARIASGSGSTPTCGDWTSGTRESRWTPYWHPRPMLTPPHGCGSASPGPLRRASPRAPSPSWWKAAAANS